MLAILVRRPQAPPDKPQRMVLRTGASVCGSVLALTEDAVY